MESNFEFITKSTLQQSQIEKDIPKLNPSQIQRPSESIESKEIINNKLCFFNEIFLYGLSEKKQFKEIDCLWSYVNPVWKSTHSISHKVKNNNLEN